MLTRTALALAALLLASSCGDDSVVLPSVLPGTIAPGLAVTTPGTLIREGRCLYLRADEQSFLLVFGLVDSSLEGDTLTIDGQPHRIGRATGLGLGWAGSATAAAPPDAAWSRRPHPSCDATWPAIVLPSAAP